MKNSILVFIGLLLLHGCYDPEESITSTRTTELSIQNPLDSIVADGVSIYKINVRIPGIRFGDLRKLTFKTNWGSWENGSSSITRSLGYDESVDAYADTLFLKASRIAKELTISVSDTTSFLGELNLKAFPNYPSSVQIISDSTSLKLIPSNSTKLRALFFSEKGFPSDGLRFRFKTDSTVVVFPKDVRIDSSEALATLQLSTNSKLDTISVYGLINNMNQSELDIDTLKIAIIN